MKDNELHYYLKPVDLLVPDFMPNQKYILCSLNKLL